MRGPCAVAPYRNAQSSAANQVALVPKTPRLVTVLTTALPMPWEARRARALSPPNRPTWSCSRSLLAVSFAAVWMRCGRRARNGPTVNWRMSQPPPERLKRGLQANLQDEIAQEIETLLGRQPVAELDFEALEMAARRQAVRLR